MSEVLVDDFLAHYGVPGMKWGKRKAEDRSGSKESTPKNANRETKRKAKSDKILAKADSTQKQIDDLKKNGANSEYLRNKYGDAMHGQTVKGHTKSDLIAAELRNLQGSKDHFLADAKLAAEGKLTNKEKMLIGAAVSTIVLAGVAGAAIYGNTGKRATKKKYLNDKAERLVKETAAKKRLDDIKSGQNITFDDFNRKMYLVESTRIAGISKDAFDKLDDTPIMVPSGHVFKRISTNSEETLRKEVYAAFKDEDVTRYKAALPRYWTQWNVGSAERGGYVIEMKAKEAIISPGKKSRVHNFIELMDEPVSGVDLHGNSVTKIGKDWMRESGLRPTEGASSKDAALQTYNDFALFLGNDSPLKSAYVDKLKAKGFNALIDDNDSGRLADAPMLIFDTTTSMQRLGATVLSKENIEKAKAQLVELVERK